MENNKTLPTTTEVEKNGIAEYGYSVNDKGQMAFAEGYTGDLTAYEYKEKIYKIVDWKKNSKNKGKQFID